MATALLPWSGVVALVIAACAAITLLGEVAFGYRPFWCALLFVLAGYAFLGKGFAYVGVGGLYVGEVALAVGVSTAILLAALGRWQPRTLVPSFDVVALVAFLCWQAARTAPFVSTYGIDALRDGALWGYAIFALCVLVLVPRTAVDGFLAIYGRMLLPFLVFAPAALAIQKLGVPIPNLPGTATPVLWPKAGDVGVHLGGIGAYLLTDHAGSPRIAGKTHAWWSWALWWVTWLTVAATGRAGALAAFVGVTVAAVLCFNVRLFRFVVAALLVVGVLALSGIRARFSGGELSYDYIATSIASIAEQQGGSAGASGLQATKQWRLDWWRDIVSYTAQGQYFWLGKGYGINLAIDDDRRGPNATLRSPHNATMTILARSGVPGLVLWLLFLGSLAWRLLRLHIASASASADRLFAAWALAYLAASLANSSFDVYLEGPMGGIWFWTVVGISLVRTRVPVKRPAAPAVGAWRP